MIIDLCPPEIKKILKYVDKTFCPTCDLFDRYDLNEITDKTDGRVNRRHCTNNCTKYLCGCGECPQNYLVDEVWDKMLGPQKQPSSVAKIEAEKKNTLKRLNEINKQ